MLIVLIALWIAGHSFEWWWFIVGFAVDVLWLSIKLNFLTILIRRSIEAAREEGGTPPATPSAG